MSNPQRVIKLRAWDEARREFVPLLTLVPDEPRPIVQFTGLLDYFGQEIWEGDIVKWTHFDEPERVFSEYHYEVAFENGCFGLQSADGEFTPFCDAGHGDVVVGNKWTDGYLMEQSLCLQW